jgi:ketosteroid isomerase-like protein
MTDDEQQALAAADRIIDDFRRHRSDAYFAGFAEDASFIFHASEKRLESRAEYQDEWARWERDDGLHVLGCRSTARRIQLFGDTAVFTHDVDTQVRLDGRRVTNLERETIVLVRRDADWICVHEHLSPRS